MLPLRYSLRSVRRRPTRSVLTMLGVGLGVFVGIGMLASARSLDRAIARSGEPANVLVHARAATQIELSSLDAGIADVLGAGRGVRVGPTGVPDVSPEIYMGTVVAVADAPGERLGVVRGVTAAAAAVHERVRPEGTWPALRGRRAMVGRLAGTKLGVPPAALAPGSRLRFEGVDWEVAATFDAPGTTIESEIWVDLGDLREAARRQDLSHVVLAMVDTAAAAKFVKDLPFRTDVVVAGRTEADYYRAYAEALRPLAVVAALLAVLVAVGGALVALNTMSANVAARVREIGTLRALGFSSGAVVVALAVEAGALALVGAAAGVGGVCAFEGLPVRMAMGAFRLTVDPSLVAAGLAAGVVVGGLGGVLPALRALTRPIAEAVRAG